MACFYVLYIEFGVWKWKCVTDFSGLDTNLSQHRDTLHSSPHIGTHSIPTIKLKDNTMFQAHHHSRLVLTLTLWVTSMKNSERHRAMHLVLTGNNDSIKKTSLCCRVKSISKRHSWAELLCLHH